MPLPVRLFAIAGIAAVLAACASAPASAPTGAPAPTARPAAVPTAAAQPTRQPASQAAPGTPPATGMGVPGGRLGIGTAYTYDAPPGAANPSRVWFGITNGAISEASYPTIAQANLKSLGVLVTDGKSFAADETSDATYAVQRLEGAAPAFRVTSTDVQGRWAVVKDIVADPQADTILFTVAFQALKGQPGDYRLFLAYTPGLGGSGAGDLSRVADGRAQAWDAQAGVYSTIVSSPPPALMAL